MEKIKDKVLLAYMKHLLYVRIICVTIVVMLILRCPRRGMNCRSLDYQEKMVIPLDH
jgi:hypothetical protein